MEKSIPAIEAHGLRFSLCDDGSVYIEVINPMRDAISSDEFIDIVNRLALPATTPEKE